LAVPAESRRWFGSERRRALRLFVHADNVSSRQFLALLVDFAFADEEARVQPAVRVRLGGQLGTRGTRQPRVRARACEEIVQDAGGRQAAPVGRGARTRWGEQGRYETV
jgi:hypothetical protein